MKIVVIACLMLGVLATAQSCDDNRPVTGIDAANPADASNEADSAGD
jgi:hypothetical protein